MHVNAFLKMSSRDQPIFEHGSPADETRSDEDILPVLVATSKILGGCYFLNQNPPDPDLIHNLSLIELQDEGFWRFSLLP